MKRYSAYIRVSEPGPIEHATLLYVPTRRNKSGRTSHGTVESAIKAMEVRRIPGQGLIVEAGTDVRNPSNWVLTVSL